MAIMFCAEEYTFYGEDFYGEKVLLEDARNVYIDQSVLPEGMLDSIKSNQTIEIEGQFYFDNDKLYITPFVIWDEYGENLIAVSYTHLTLPTILRV